MKERCIKRSIVDRYIKSQQKLVTGDLMCSL